MFFAGNICRSPIAEAVFVKLLKDSGKTAEWKVDSAAIGSWHVGRSPDRRAISVLSKHGITTPHKARQARLNFPCCFQILPYILLYMLGEEIWFQWIWLHFWNGWWQHGWSELACPIWFKSKIGAFRNLWSWGRAYHQGSLLCKSHHILNLKVIFGIKETFSVQDNGEEGFEKCYQQCIRCLQAFLGNS